MADEIRTSIEFAADPDTNGVEFYWTQSVPNLTPEQATVITRIRTSAALEKIADALINIADAIRETKEP